MSRQTGPMDSMNPGNGNAETPSRTTVVSETREREINRNPITWQEIQTLMRETPERVPRRTWMPVFGGVLSMVAGMWNIIVGAGIILGSLALNVVSPSFLWGFGSFALVGNSAGIALVILGVISSIGGYLAARRSSWGLALIGSIAALVPSPVIVPFFMGVTSLVLVALGRKEFNKEPDYRQMK